MSFPPFILPVDQLLISCVISSYICTLKAHICAQYLSRLVINAVYSIYVGTVYTYYTVHTAVNTD